MKKLTRMLMVTLASATFLAAYNEPATLDEDEPTPEETQGGPMEETEEEPAEGEEAGDEAA